MSSDNVTVNCSSYKKREGDGATNISSISILSISSDTYAYLLELRITIKSFSKLAAVQFCNSMSFFKLVDCNKESLQRKNAAKHSDVPV